MSAKDSTDSILNSILRSYHYRDFPETKEEYPTYVIIIAIALPFAITLAYLLYKYLKNRIWMKGTFPFDLPFNTENQMEAYMALTASFILQDRYKQREKVIFMKGFFQKHFKSLPKDISSSIHRNFDYPMDPASVSSWLNRNLKNEESKKQVLYFLVGLCHIDGTMHRREYEILKGVASVLQLEITFLDAIIHNYKDWGKEKKTKQTVYQNVASKKKMYADILGVGVNAALSEIKQRYRTLAKEFHPDRLNASSEEEKRTAHESFIQIQEAYEYFTNEKK